MPDTALKAKLKEALKRIALLEATIVDLTSERDSARASQQLVGQQFVPRDRGRDAVISLLELPSNTPVNAIVARISEIVDEWKIMKKQLKIK